MIIDITGNLVIDKKTRDWCKLPYPGHPKGCPNYNKKDTCPPIVPLVTDKFDLSQQHWIAVTKFNLKEHASALKEKHPDWSDKQCRCCLYWQNTVRKELRGFVNEFIKEMNFISNFSANIGELDSTLIPEAMGVNIFRTCHRVGIKIKKNPSDIVYKVALIGYLI